MALARWLPAQPRRLGLSYEEPLPHPGSLVSGPLRSFASGRGSSFSDGTQVRLGGLGGAANQKNYRGVLAAPMLASLNNTQLKKSDNQYQIKGIKMNKPNSQKHQTTPYKLTHLIFVTSLLLFSIFTSSCSTTCHRREAALHVLEQQNAAIQALKTERESGAIRAKAIMPGSRGSAVSPTQVTEGRRGPRTTC